MSDARALLRAEKASRRITHPHASYNKDGKLLCNLCETLVKSEAQWQGHLHSTQHNLRSQRQQDAAAARGTKTDGGGKKRKAESIESPQQDRKKARPEPAAKVEQDADVPEAVVEDTIVIEDSAAHDSQPNGTARANPKQPPESDINPDDIAAFERELDALEADAAREEQQAREEAVRNAATISAAPLTAEQLAAQAREEQSAQRGRRDLELEEEREDAARVVEEEMEEMEGLEERVRVLRERRERLRRQSWTERDGGTGVDVVAVEAGLLPVDAVEEVEKEGESSDEDEDFDEWKFGGS